MRLHPFLLALGVAAAIVGAWVALPAPATQLPDPHVKVETKQGHGSATHIGDGLFVTAAHVVDGQEAITIDGLPVTVLHFDQASDIAVLQGSADYRSTPLACVTPRVGQQGIAYGNPVMLEEISVQVRFAGKAVTSDHWRVAVPIDGAVAPGMSGGGIVSGGRLIAVVVGAALAPTQIGLPSYFGVGFAVPGAVVCELLGRGA